MMAISMVENWRVKVIGPLLWSGGTGERFVDCMPGLRGILHCILCVGADDTIGKGSLGE